MKNWKNILISPKTPIIETMKVLEECASQLVIIAEKFTILGTITDGDIRRGILNGVSLEEPSEKIMFKDFSYAVEGTSREELLNIMKEKLINGLPIISKDNKIVDVISINELGTPLELKNHVVLMAGGLGSRLGDLTEKCPKPLLKIGEQPILENIIQNFKKYGFKTFHLSVNYKSEMIEDHFADGKKLNVNISYIKEKKKLGTAGSLSLLNLTKINDPIIVMNGDLLTKVDFQKLINFHESNKNIATMCIRQYDVQIPYGVVNSEDGEIKSLVEKPTQSFFVNAGIYVFSPEALQSIPKDQYYDMNTFFDSLIERKQKTGVFPIHEYWLDIGKVDDLHQARKDIKDNF